MSFIDGPLPSPSPNLGIEISEGIIKENSMDLDSCMWGREKYVGGCRLGFFWGELLYIDQIFTAFRIATSLADRYSELGYPL